MKKYIFIVLGLVVIALFTFYFIGQQQYNYKYLYQNNKNTEQGNLIFNENKKSVYLNGNKVILRNNENLKINSVTLPESHFTNLSILNNKSRDNYPLIGRQIKTGLKLINEKNIYLVEIEPDVRLISSYPNPQTSNDKIIISKSKNILYLYHRGQLYKFYNVATGKDPEYTPEGFFKIANKEKLPNGDDPDSLYGPRWMGLSVPYEKDLRANGQKDSRAPIGHKYGIHGTNEPDSIGTHASGGCIRMNNKEVIKIFDLIKIGTPVEIIK